MRRGAAGCFSAEFCGDIFPLKFTGKEASKYGPLNLVSIIVLFNFQERFFCRTQYMFLWVGFLLHILVCVVIPVKPFPLGYLVSCGALVSVAVCNVVFFSCFNWCVFFYVFVSFCRTRAIFLPNQGSIYAGGVSNFCHLTVMFLLSLGSVLIYG